MEVERAVDTPIPDFQAPRPTERSSGPPQRRALRHRPAPRAAVEIVLAVVAATLVSGFVQAAVSRLDIPMPSHMPTAIAAVLSLLIVLALAGLVLAYWRRWSWPLVPGIWVALAALTTVALALPLQGTQYYFGGISIDQSFRMQYLTRLTDSALLLDMNYIDTAPFYPAGWFWLGGRFASLLGLEGWQAYKPWSLLSMAVVPAVSFSLWSMLVQRPVAALLALATALVGLGLGSMQLHPWPFMNWESPVDVVPLGADATEPYAWLLAGLLPPIGVIAFRALNGGLGAAERRNNGEHRPGLIGAGIFLGLSGAFYTLYLGFACLLLAALALTGLLQAKRRHGLRPTARTLFQRLLTIGVVALPLVLLVWTPYLLQTFTRGWPGTGAAPQFLPLASALLPFPMLEFSVVGLISLLGFGWLLLRFQRNDMARALGVFVLACYAWFVLSAVALAAGTTLLPLRLLSPLTVALVCAGVLGSVEGMQALLRYVSRDARRAATIAVALLGVIAAVSVAQSVPQVHREGLHAAYGDYYPTGVNALGHEDREVAGPWYPDLHQTIMTETRKRPRDLVVLTNHYGLLTFYPYWGFQQPTAHFANPLADYEGRLQEVERWADAQSTEDFLARLDNSPYRPPTVFVLSDETDGYHAIFTRDSFPRHPNAEEFSVVFDKGLFSAEYFTKTSVGPFVVLIRR